MSIFNHLQKIDDPRSHINQDHNFIDVMFLAFSAVLSGASGWKDMQTFGDEQLAWLRQYRPFKNGIPRRHCIANIISAIDTDILVMALLSWINERRTQTGKSIIAIDGKTLRSSWHDDVHKALNVVSAYDVENGIALYQRSADSKGKEIELGQQIIEMLALENTVITLDALHCQTDTLNKIVSKNGDFVVQVKANQEGLHRAVQEQFKHAYDAPETMAECVERNRGHGREEVRTVMQIDANLSAAMKLRWPHVKTFIEVASERTENGQTSCDSRWYVSSLPRDAAQAAHVVRRHWGIENELHWVLDVVFREDEMTIADARGAAHVALFNRVAISLIKQHKGKKDSVRSKRQAAAWGAKFRSELIFG